MSKPPQNIFLDTALPLILGRSTRVAGAAAARVVASKHFDPLQQRIYAVVECLEETNQDLQRNRAIEFWDGFYRPSTNRC